MEGDSSKIGVRWPVAAALAAASVLLLGVAGCGSTKERTNSLRPPTPIDVAVRIGDDRIDASPHEFGAGPIVLQVSNQSSVSHTLTIDGPQVSQSVGPINPEDTATLKVTVKPGEQTLTVNGSVGAKPARLTVGPLRPSAQNQLLQP